MALQEKDKIKDLFSSKLKDFEPDLPAGLWPGIEQALSRQPIVANRPVKKYIGLNRTISVAASIVGLLIICGSLLFINKPDSKGIRIGQGLSGNNLPYRIVEEFPDYTGAAHTEASPISDMNRQVKSKKAALNGYPVLLSVNSPDLLLCEATASNVNTVIGVKNNQIKTGQRSRFSDTSPVVLPKKGKRNAGNMLELNINGGSGMLTANTNQSGALMTFTTKNHPEITKEPTFRDNIIDLEHNQPISFGLTVSKQLASRLSVETGITYTYLSSTFKTLYSDAVDEKISFHYLGVPLSLNYTFLQLGKADFYISAGGRLEKDVQGRYNSTLKNSNTGSNSSAEISTSEIPVYTTSYVKKNIHQDHIQFSTHMSVGTSFPIYQKLYIHGNVGGAYYFDANNEYPTIYSDKKLQLDLNLGLKLKF